MMITKNPKEFWEKKSKVKNWREYILPKRNDEEFWEEGKKEAENIKQFMDDNAFVIDYGCGIGRISRYFKDYCETLVGLDICEKFVKYCFSRTGAKCYQTEKYKGQGVATFIYSISVLQHNTDENRKKIINHIHSLLRPNGKCLINFPKRGEVYKKTVFVDTFTKEELKKMFSAFSKVEIKEGNLIRYAGKSPKRNNEFFVIATK